MQYWSLNVIKYNILNNIVIDVRLDRKIYIISKISFTVLSCVYLLAISLLLFKNKRRWKLRAIVSESSGQEFIFCHWDHWSRIYTRGITRAHAHSDHNNSAIPVSPGYTIIRRMGPEMDTTPKTPTTCRYNPIFKFFTIEQFMFFYSSKIVLTKKTWFFFCTHDLPKKAIRVYGNIDHISCTCLTFKWQSLMFALFICIRLALKVISF